MTQEEKAKRYDETLEQLRGLIEGTREDKCAIVEEDIIHIFPELKESEEEMVEKIRKDIISYLNNRQITSIAESSATERWLAWLEKQGKEEYALKSFKHEDVRKFMQYIEKEANAYEFNLPNRGYDIYAFAKDILTWLEKQGANSVSVTKANTSITNAEDVEQKPSLRERYDNIAKSEWFKKTHEGMSVSDEESKWGYEDEANLNNIIWLCNNCLNGAETTWIPSQAEKIKHLIETIKERGLTQPKQEWGEEDNKRIDRIYDFLWKHKRGFSSIIWQIEEDANWLKSLKQRMKE